MTTNFIISYPRSGHHLVERFIEFYCKHKNINYSYCEYYKCCRKNPCIYNKLFQKNHDFGLMLSIEDKYKYLVLYRDNFLEQMESYYRYHKYDSKNIVYPNSIFYNIDERTDLYNFIRSHRDSYFNFLNKWVLNTNTNILKISYDNVILNNYELKKILLFFFDDDNTESIINKFISIEPIHKQHTISDYINNI